MGLARRKTTKSRLARLLLYLSAMRTSLLGIALSLVLGTSSLAYADGPAADAEETVLGIIAAARTETGAPTLRRDADLDEAALLHAEDMAAHGFVAHESPRTGDPSARVAMVGFVFARVGENVARAASAEEAAMSLVASEAHRAQMVDAGFTHVGVAVVEGEDGFYVVEVFAASAAGGEEIPPPVAIEAPAPQAIPEQPSVAPYASEAPSEYAQPSYPQAGYAQPSYPQAGYAQPSYPQAANVQASGLPQAFVSRGPSAAAGTTPPTVVLEYTPPTNVQGYWVQHEGRWWFYAIPQGARPGTVLSAVPGGNGPTGVGTSPLQVSQQPTQPYASAPRAPYAAPQQPAYRPSHGPLRNLIRPSPRRGRY